MHSNIYSFVVAPILGWLALVSLLIVGYLTYLEILERRRLRRMDRKRAEMLSSHGPYRPKTPAARRPAFHRGVSPIINSPNCLKTGQVFPRIDRHSGHTGWDFRAADLN